MMIKTTNALTMSVIVSILLFAILFAMKTGPDKAVVWGILLGLVTFFTMEVNRVDKVYF